MSIIYVTVFWKTDRIDTNTEIHFLLVDKNKVILMHYSETPST